MDSPVMQFSPQPDAGTPLVSGADEVTVTIDGLPVSVGAGTSIMRAAYDAGIQVPKLCASDAEGKQFALLFGYACHSTTLSFYEFCGDGVDCLHPARPWWNRVW